MSVRGYLLAIDWDNTGDPAVTGDDVTSDVLSEPNLAVEWGRETSQVGSQPSVGNFDFALRNDLHRYSPENASSPLFGKIGPGRRVQLQHLNTPYVELFDGVLDQFEAEPSTNRFEASCLDAWGAPGAEKLSTPVYRGLRTGDAVHLVLDAIGWTGGRAVDTGVTVMPWWWEEDTDGASAIEKLVDSEGPPAIAYVQGGVFVFEDRHHRLLSAASTTSNGTYTHIVPAGSGPAGDFKILKDSFSYDHGLSRIVNSVTFTVEERAAQNPTSVWSTDTPITLASGQSLDLFVSTPDPFIQAGIPQQDTDYTLASGAVTMSLSRVSGQSTVITIVASSASIITWLSLPAAPIPVVRTRKVSVSDTSSIGKHGRRSWNRDAPWANIYDARAIAGRIVATYATNRPVISFEIADLDSTYLEQIRTRRISDRITVRNDVLGLNTDFIIEKIQHSIRGFTLHRMRLTCEVPPPTQPANVFTFDVAGHGFNDGAFGLDGIDSATNVFMFDVAGHGFNDGLFGT